MNLDLILRQLDLERRTLVMDGEEIEILPSVTRVRSLDGLRQAIAFSRLSSQNTDDVIAGQVAHYRALQAEVEWKLYATTHPPTCVNIWPAMGS